MKPIKLLIEKKTTSCLFCIFSGLLFSGPPALTGSHPTQAPQSFCSLDGFAFCSVLCLESFSFSSDTAPQLAYMPPVFCSCYLVSEVILEQTVYFILFVLTVTCGIFSCSMWDLVQTSSLCRQCEVLAIGSPGKSLEYTVKIGSSLLSSLS